MNLVPDPVTDTSPLHVVEPEPAAPELAPEPDAGDAPLLAQLEEQWAKLAAAEEALVERERELEELARSHDRERLERAERERELTELAESRERELAELAERRERDVAEVAESRERELTELAESRDRALAELAEDRDREVAQLTDRARELSELTESRERELAASAERERELRELAESRERELGELAKSRDREGELAEGERELRELAESREREFAELAEHTRELSELAESRERELAGLTERHQHDVRRLEELNERLREEVEQLRNAPTAPEQGDPAPAPFSSHLVFVQLDERYELISRECPPPAPSTPLELPDVDEGMFVVAGRRSSPLPGDGRPCVFVQRG